MEDSAPQEVSRLKSVMTKLESRIQPKKVAKKIAPWIVAGAAGAVTPLVTAPLVNKIVDWVVPPLVIDGQFGEPINIRGTTQESISDFRSAYKEPKRVGAFGPSEYTDMANKIRLGLSIGERSGFTYHDAHIEVYKNPEVSGLPKPILDLLESTLRDEPTFAESMQESIPEYVRLQSVLAAKRTVVLEKALVTENLDGTYSIFSLSNLGAYENVDSTKIESFEEVFSKYPIEPYFKLGALEGLRESNISAPEAMSLLSRFKEIRTALGTDDEAVYQLHGSLLNILYNARTPEVRDRVLNVYLDMIRLVHSGGYESKDMVWQANELITHYESVSTGIDTLEAVWKKYRTFYENHMEKHGNKLPMKIVIDALENLEIKKIDQSEIHTYLDKLIQLRGWGTEFVVTDPNDTSQEAKLVEVEKLLVSSPSPIDAVDKYRELLVVLGKDIDYGTFVELFKAFDRKDVSLEKVGQVYADYRTLDSMFADLKIQRSTIIPLLVDMPSGDVRDLLNSVKVISTKVGINEWEMPMVIDLLVSIRNSGKEITTTVNENVELLLSTFHRSALSILTRDGNKIPLEKLDLSTPIQSESDLLIAIVELYDKSYNEFNAKKFAGFLNTTHEQASKYGIPDMRPELIHALTPDAMMHLIASGGANFPIHYYDQKIQSSIQIDEMNEGGDYNIVMWTSTFELIQKRLEDFSQQHPAEYVKLLQSNPEQLPRYMFMLARFGKLEGTLQTSPELFIEPLKRILSAPQENINDWQMLLPAFTEGLKSSRSEDYQKLLFELAQECQSEGRADGLRSIAYVVKTHPDLLHTEYGRKLNYVFRAYPQPESVPLPDWSQKKVITSVIFYNKKDVSEEGTPAAMAELQKDGFVLTLEDPTKLNWELEKTLPDGRRIHVYVTTDPITRFEKNKPDMFVTAFHSFNDAGFFIPTKEDWSNVVMYNGYCGSARNIVFRAKNGYTGPSIGDLDLGEGFVNLLITKELLHLLPYGPKSWDEVAQKMSAFSRYRGTRFPGDDQALVNYVLKGGLSPVDMHLNAMEWASWQAFYDKQIKPQ